MNTNTLLCLDWYKAFHMVGYPEKTNKVYSYLCPRYSKEFKNVVYFGLQYYLKEYLTKPITKEHVDEFLHYREKSLGPTPQDVKTKMYNLANLGYWPLEIRSLPEGTVLPVGNAVATIENTHPDFFWCVGYIESLLLKVWFPTTVATQVYEYRKLVRSMFDKTVSQKDMFLEDWVNHDFGYRSCQSEDAAAISGAAFLLFSKGSDTVVSYPFIDKYYQYDDKEIIMGSVPATEHALVCSYGRENELEHYKQMLKLCPSGIISLVSDTYDIWNVCTNIIPSLKNEIMQRDGKLVVRPDSGVPENIICGDPNASFGSPANKGAMRLLDECFGHTINEKGYKVLDSHIGLIYGDSMSIERYRTSLERLESMGYASNNLVIGAGGILRKGHRDTLGFAQKAIHVEIDGIPREIYKDPITDSNKKSHCGYLQVVNDDGILITKDRVSEKDKNNSLLVPVFKDGKLLKEYKFDEIRKTANSGL